jgi:phage terminase large subunit-like protein
LRKPRNIQPPKNLQHPTHAYAWRVVNGHIPACITVKKACQRHLTDLEIGAKRRLYFDEKAANWVFAFFELLPVVKGYLAIDKTTGKRTTIVLDSWQKFYLGCKFGWKRADGTRRFRRSYLEIAKGHGKSTLSGGEGLYMLLADGEAGPDIFCAATIEDQAKIVWRSAKQMAELQPLIANQLKILDGTYTINSPQNQGFFKPLGRDSKTKDGLRPHCAIFDEFHAIDDPTTYQNVKSGMVGRSQPMLTIITTAGTNFIGICKETHDTGKKILDGEITDDDFFILIYQLDPGDKWTDKSVWYKANPNLLEPRHAKEFKDFLDSQYNDAVNTPANQSIFKTKNLNMWLQGESKWIPVAVWDKGNTPPVFTGKLQRTAYIGLDIGQTYDLTAIMLLMPTADADEQQRFFDIECQFFCPEDTIEQRTKQDGVPYTLWAQNGFITTTPGGATDKRIVQTELIKTIKKHNVKYLGADRYDAMQMCVELNEMFPNPQKDVDFAQFVPQSIAAHSPPLKDIEMWALQSKIRHGGNPVLRWMLGNARIIKDTNGNYKITKKHEKDKIDGLTALANAVFMYKTYHHSKPKRTATIHL